MKKNLILPVFIGCTLFVCALFISDGLTYLTATLMAFIIMFTINRNKGRVIKMTRWSKSNPKKAQVLITLLQVVILALGILTGYNLKELGYEFSNTTSIVFGAIIFISFLNVPFLPSRKLITVPKVVNRQRFAFMCIALSSFTIMVIFGNRLQDTYPDSVINKAVNQVDKAIFPVDNSSDLVLNIAAMDEADTEKNTQSASTQSTAAKIVFASLAGSTMESTTPETELKDKTDKKTKKFEKKKAKLTKLLKKHRLAAAGMSTGLAVALIILLCIPLCAGICLILMGETAGAVIGGIALTGATIFGIVKVGKSLQKTKQEKL